jgi:hypothetical protein
MSVGVSVLNPLGGAMFPVADATQCHSVSRLPVVDRQDIHFTKLTPGGEVLNTCPRDITQDKQGFIWLASDTGFYRYEGHALSRHRHGPGHDKTVSSDGLKTVFADRKGLLQIRTVFGGVGRFDLPRGTFMEFRHEPQRKGQL